MFIMYCCLQSALRPCWVGRSHEMVHIIVVEWCMTGSQLLLMHAVSSEAMLGGQKSPYKLLVRAVNQHTGQEVPYITFVASEDFVVSDTCNKISDTSPAHKHLHDVA